MLEQTAVYNEIDKLRKELNEYSYKAKDVSYLFNTDNSFTFKKEEQEKSK